MQANGRYESRIVR